MEEKNVSKVNSALVSIIIVLLILLGIAGYFLFIKKGDVIEKGPYITPTPTTTSQDNPNINKDILNYECGEEYCDTKDYMAIRDLLKATDSVKSLHYGKDHKLHVIILDNASNGSKYLYSVDRDKYYFKDDNYTEITLITGAYERDFGYTYDYDHALVHKRINKQYVETSDTKLYSFNDEKFVFEDDDYYEGFYAEYNNQRYYELRQNGDSTLYDSNFNKVFEEETHGNYSFDDKYIYGVIEKDSKYRFFKYSIADKKYTLSSITFDYDASSDCTYNYIVKSNNGEYEVYDFDGNLIFKTDEKTNLKNVKTKDYTMPDMPKVYYSKAENKIKLIIDPDICGDESCPPHFGYSYYEYDLGSKKTTYKFYTDIIPDEIYDKLINGYTTL